MQATTHPQRDAAFEGDRGDPTLQPDDGRDRCSGITEHGVQPIPGHLDDFATMRLDDGAAEVVMASESVAHPCRLGLPKARAALDVGKEKRYSAGAATRVHQAVQEGDECC